ncbi:MAG: enoyl-CoA hydratase/isomerase family protein [Paracoccus sp. (in: a-proteobacteria)]|uniref:enoyl-CoA hydratase/isomerase family protein n=1 Tax=Paracoccus sp. TaxID=267 RepID=UPI00391A4E53
MIRIEQKAGGEMALLVIDRPGKANALTEQMLRDLTEGLERLAQAGAKAVILTGRGKVFSAGADLEAARAGLAQSDAWAALSGRMASMPCLTIAALNGTLAGGAFGMVLACDIRLAVPEAEFFYPVMRLGYQPPQGDPERMVQLIGPARTRMILMAGARIAAPEAVSWGLIDRILPAPDLMDGAAALAATCLGASRDHIAAIKARVQTCYSPALL